MTKTRFNTTLKTRRNAPEVPGDTSLVLTAPAVDETGTTYPRGTVLVPLCSGYDNQVGSRYTEVTILG